MRNKGDSPPPETTQGWSAPRIFNPPDWVALTPAFGQYRSDGPNNLATNNLAATCFDRDVHEGLLRLGLVASDGTYREPGAATRQKLNIRVPLNYREGCSIEPYYEGRWYVWRYDLDRRTTIPSTAVRAEESMPEPAPATEPSPPGEPKQPVSEKTAIRRRRRGPRPGTIDRFAQADRALFSEMTALIKQQHITPTEAARMLSDKIEGRGVGDSKVRRLAERYRKEVGKRTATRRNS
jgi:hypothetical protein